VYAPGRSTVCIWEERERETKERRRPDYFRRSRRRARPAARLPRGGAGARPPRTTYRHYYSQLSRPRPPLVAGVRAQPAFVSRTACDHGEMNLLRAPTRIDGAGAGAGSNSRQAVPYSASVRLCARRAAWKGTRPCNLADLYVIPPPCLGGSAARLGHLGASPATYVEPH
jgi:hypothetical protein